MILTGGVSIRGAIPSVKMPIRVGIHHIPVAVDDHGGSAVRVEDRADRGSHRVGAGASSDASESTGASPAAEQELIALAERHMS